MDTSVPFFSLVLCSINRTSELDCFLKSAASQHYERLEIIIVDQNKDCRLVPVIEKYESVLKIRRVHSAPGLSRARNVGLALARGEWIAFPDDDCIYPADLLNKIASTSAAHPKYDGISTLVTDENGNFSAGGYMGSTQARITKSNIWRCAVSPSIFLKRAAVGQTLFDERLGAGSGTCFGSGEETDFLLSIINGGAICIYIPTLVVHHPVYNGEWDTDRAWKYGCGMGAVLCKHGYSHIHACYYAGLQIIRVIQSFLFLRFRKGLFHFIQACGRISGFMKFKQITAQR